MQIFKSTFNPVLCCIFVVCKHITVSWFLYFFFAGGFEAFQSCFPYLCETQDKSKCPTITQLSQPCLPITSIGPTKVLSHLYLGSQQDVLDENLLQQNGINYVLNISKTCPAPSYIPANHFLRIPVKDNYGETILSWLDDAIQFIGKSYISSLVFKWFAIMENTDYQ